MRPKIMPTITGVGTSAIWVPDRRPVPTNIAVAVDITGTVTYTVQYTYDNVQAPGFTPAGATWRSHATLVNLSANGDGNFAYPPRGIRLNVTAGTGTCSLRIIQSGT